MVAFTFFVELSYAKYLHMCTEHVGFPAGPFAAGTLAPLRDSEFDIIFDMHLCILFCHQCAPTTYMLYK